MQTNVYMNSLTSYEYMHNFFSPFPLTSNEQKASGNNPGEERQVIRNVLRYLQSAFWQSNKPEGKRHQICFCIFFFHSYVLTRVIGNTRPVVELVVSDMYDLLIYLQW